MVKKSVREGGFFCVLTATLWYLESISTLEISAHETPLRSIIAIILRKALKGGFAWVVVAAGVCSSMAGRW